MSLDSVWRMEHLWTVFVLVGGWLLKTLCTERAVLLAPIPTVSFDR